MKEFTSLISELKLSTKLILLGLFLWLIVCPAFLMTSSFIFASLKTWTIITAVGAGLSGAISIAVGLILVSEAI